MSALLGAGVSLIGGLLGSSSAKKAAAAQAAVENRKIDLAQDNLEYTRDLYAPFYQSGLNAQNALAYEILGGDVPMMTPSGLSVEEFTSRGPDQTETYMDGGPRGMQRTRTIPGAETTRYRVGGEEFDTRGAADQYLASQGTAYGGYQKSPGYEFRLQEGLGALEGSAAAQGNYFSGNTLKGLVGYGQDYATADRENYLNRLSGLANTGSAAAGNQATAGANFVNTAGNALSGIGNAQAAGAIGSANAWQGAIGNALGAYQYGKTTGDVGFGMGFNPGGGGSWMNGLFG